MVAGFGRDPIIAQMNSWLVFVLILLLQAQFSRGWFFSSNKDAHSREENSNNAPGKVLVGEFSMEAFNNKKGVELLENVKDKMLTDGCMQNAYQTIFRSCSKIMADHELKSRFAWHLTDCFEKSSGRPAFPNCNPKASMSSCIKQLDNHAHDSYRTFYLEVNNLCHQLQNEAFRLRTEYLVNELKSSAENVEDRLVNLGEQGEQLLQNSKHIHDSLNLIDIGTQKIAETTKNVEWYVNDVLKHSEIIYEQSKDIALSQGELKEGQQRMKEKLEEGMVIIQESYDNLGLEVTNLRNEAIEIEKQIGEVGDATVSRLSTLQLKADDIWNMSGISLDKQKELLDIQKAALEGLESLSKFQSQAMEESRRSLQEMADFARTQQEEHLQRQKQVELAQHHLIQNSKTILETQEAFASKQVNMFEAIDKLFALHNAMLLESRLIRTVLYYCLAIFVVYMFTSTKQTYDVRPRLYIGLCITFFIETTALKFATDNAERQLQIISWIRLLYTSLAATQLIYSVIKFRDYELLNHHMLSRLIDKVNNMEKSKMSWDANTDEDSEVDWASWVDEELPEEVDRSIDPDYIHEKDVRETSPLVKRYNLRNRH
ncbi:hypothetical protein LIER_32597 [Lithospermum erythrorhizon]|uniref:Protein GAMETE EXPRESSED 1 n=1 Tax=Lithospermum erythrorhizon TaxID=34254 RepID=A0AAV3RWI5_LITER